MGVYLTNSSGVINKSIYKIAEPAPDSQFHALSSGIASWNLQNPSSPKRFCYMSDDAKFPPSGFKLANTGELVQLTADEILATQDLGVDKARLKVNEQQQIVPKTWDDLIAAGQATLDDAKIFHKHRLEYESGICMEGTSINGTYQPGIITASGYNLSALSRQILAVSISYQSTADSNAEKSDLISKNLCYPTARTKEMSALLGKLMTGLQAAFTAVDGKKTAADMQTISFKDYIK